MNTLNLFFNAYEIIQDLKKKSSESEEDIMTYIARNVDELGNKLNKEISGRDVVLKVLSSKKFEEAYPELSDFVRKNYLDMKIK